MDDGLRGLALFVSAVWTQIHTDKPYSLHSGPSKGNTGMHKPPFFTAVSKSIAFF
jgi:hypothetical protein